jgi:broad specificity phosphatase PhoE
VRHAPTADNANGVIMGQRDPEPTGEGLAGASGLLGDVAFGTVASSDAVRALRTAQAIAPGARIVRDARLRERALGDWENCAKAPLRRTHAEAFGEGGAVRLDADVPGGEPLSDLLLRVHAALADLRRAPAPVLVVAHNGSLRAALILLGLMAIDAASGGSIAHLAPIPADLATLRDPAAVAA